MEQKRIDVLIAIAAFVQLIALGSGSTMILQIFDERRDVGLLVFSTVSFQVTTTVTIIIYFKILETTKTKTR